MTLSITVGTVRHKMKQNEAWSEALEARENFICRPEPFDPYFPKNKLILDLFELYHLDYLIEPKRPQLHETYAICLVKCNRMR